ncbi:MAG: polysaccharide deacetylase family protein [bacterium]|nr:polysaccharide deacetylase family protein [bacterium]
MYKIVRNILLIVIWISLFITSKGSSYVVIGDKFSDISLERRVYDSLKEHNLASRIINIDSLRYKDKVVVGITFFYGLFYTQDREKIHQDLITYSTSLSKVVFCSFPYVTELDLSGVYRDSNRIEDSYKEPTFTASIYRKDFESLFREDQSLSLLLDKTGRVWYSDALLKLDLSSLKKESYIEENSNRKVDTSRKNLWVILRNLWLTYRKVRTGGTYKNTIWRGNPHLKEISITFDDGPRPVYMPIILDILNRYSVKATFFLVGKRVKLYPYFAKDIIENGHTIGNHTMHHLNLTTLSYDKKYKEILEAQDIIYSTTGERCRYFRPPGGDYDKDIEEILKKHSIYLVLWTKKLGDYLIPQSKGKLLLERVKRELIPGAIIIFHIGSRSTIDILPQFIDYARREGYKIVPLEKLIEDAR